MTGNTFGKAFQLTTFGESHGPAIGGIIHGCPAGLAIDLESVQRELDRRKPGQSALTTQRKESDKVEFLSGIFEGKSTGTPLGFVIKNKDHHSNDYDHLKSVYRPSHADFTYDQKYGGRDHRGGGRSSARETASRVVGGALARQLLTTQKIVVGAFVSQVGKVKLSQHPTFFTAEQVDANDVRCPDRVVAVEMMNEIERVKSEGDSLGGVITCVVRGVPAGLGEPVFDKLHADLAKAMMSINAVKGFEIGSGFSAAAMQGSAHNDHFIEGGETKTNNSGGIQGGISNGQDIYFNVAFKPVATIAKAQPTIDTSGDVTELKAKGRHDPCVVPRAVPIVEAMACLCLADHFLRNRLAKLN